MTYLEAADVSCNHLTMELRRATTAPVTVTDLIRTVRKTLQGALDLVRVTGEISNFRRPSSGHCYFTLKDADAQLRCVLFRSDASRLSFALQDGMQVIVTGRIDIYEPRGDLQLRAIDVQAAGEGALQKAFEQLKQRLLAEGLFEPERKKPIPQFPRRIGVVTSRTGAALRDIVTVLDRRFPVVDVVVVPVPVQGVDAAQQIADAIRCLSDLAPGDPHRPDVLIVGRGGGSVEDLWSFNEEVVARAIHTCTIPVVSAVGHETDVSIADFAADVRAATPSMAAEIVVPDRASLIRAMHASVMRVESHVRGVMGLDRRRLHHLLRSVGFDRPRQRVEQLQQRADDFVERMRVLQRHRLSTAAARVQALARHMDALDPRRTLERGYVRVERDGTPVIRGADLAKDEEVQLRFFDESRGARITS